MRLSVETGHSDDGRDRSYEVAEYEWHPSQFRALAPLATAVADRTDALARGGAR